jgi:hypothetical protein
VKKITLVATVVVSMVFGALIVGVVRPATAAPSDPQLGQIVAQLKTLNARIGLPAGATPTAAGPVGGVAVNQQLAKIEKHLALICLNTRQGSAVSSGC